MTAAAQHLRPEEPAAGPWEPWSVGELVARLGRGGPSEGRPLIVAVDGRGASGKSTLARALSAAVPGSVVVHTDDVAWHEPYFEWAHLLLADILEPVREGRPVDHRPGAWERKGREGSIRVPAGLGLVVVEGTGAGDTLLGPVTDVLVWVQSSVQEAERRGIARDVAEGTNGDYGQTVAFWHDWQASEIEYLQRQRPWERAGLVVDGTPQVPAPAGGYWVADLAPPAHRVPGARCQTEQRCRGEYRQV